jgi:membrane protein
MKLRELPGLLKQTYAEWRDDQCPMLGAALSYYTLFSLAPLLLIAVALAGRLFGEDAARGRVVEQLQDTMGPTAAQAIEAMLVNARQRDSGILATLIGVGVLFFGAASVFLQLQTALNAAWDIPPKPGRGILGLIKDRMLAFGLVLVIGFLLLTSMVLSAALAGFSGYLDEWTFGLTGRILNETVSFAIATVLFALIYKFLPEAEIAWKDVWVGGAITSLLFTIGKALLGLYLGRSTVASMYGAAGSLVVILLWVYYSAQIVLFGAEFTQVYANRYGSRIVPEK